MSGGRSTLWRTSLCGVVMALAAFSTGCAVDASSDAEDGTIEAQADLVTDAPGSAKVGEPVGSPQAPTTTTTTTETKAPATGKVEEVVEPEPDPWHPRSRARADSDTDSIATRSALKDDRK
jgi:hypothetical protein